MKSYTKVYILLIVLIIIFAFMLSYTSKIEDASWDIKAIYALCLSSVISIMDKKIFKKYNKDKGDNYYMSPLTKLLIIIIDIAISIIASVYSIIHACKSTDIRIIELISVGVFYYINSRLRVSTILTFIGSIKKEKDDNEK